MSVLFVVREASFGKGETPRGTVAQFTLDASVFTGLS